MKSYPEVSRPLDARLASWLTTSSVATVGYHLSCGLRPLDREETAHGSGPGWLGRALAAVLRECYRRQLENATLEEVEIVALCVLPAPEPDDDAAMLPSMPSARERWEAVVGVTAKVVHRILRYGPAAGMAGGDIVFTGGTLRAEVSDLELEQRIDMIWRRPDGVLEAVVVFEEPLERNGLRSAEEDWRCVLAAAVVRSLYGENPDVHTVWVCSAAARVSRITDLTLDDRLGRLDRVLEAARGFEGLTETDEDVFYHLAEMGQDASYWPASRRRHTGSGQRSGE